MIYIWVVVETWQCRGWWAGAPSLWGNAIADTEKEWGLLSSPPPSLGIPKCALCGEGEIELWNSRVPGRMEGVCSSCGELAASEATRADQGPGDNAHTRLRRAFDTNLRTAHFAIGLGLKAAGL